MQKGGFVMFKVKVTVWADIHKNKIISALPLELLILLQPDII